MLIIKGIVMEQEVNQNNRQAFELMQQSGYFDIAPCEKPLDLDDTSKFARLNIASVQQMQVSALMQSVPLAAAAGTLANAYTVSFPEGLPHTLTKLKQGGWGSMLRGADGKFAGTASFHQMSVQAAMLGAFTAMSVATGQYFMAQIHRELNMINLKMDKILEFLYGEKKAELMAEISFVKYAYQNFPSIMEYDAQRTATIASLQQAKKVAMKDIEFYLGDLDAKTAEEAKAYTQLEKLVSVSFQVRSSLELSMQLYVMSTLLEMQYAQNMDREYVSYLETEMTIYIEKCEKRILSSFSGLKARVDSYKAKPIEKIDKAPELQKIGALIDSLNGGEESSARKAIREILHAPEQQITYYVKQDGSLYVSNVM